MAEFGGDAAKADAVVAHFTDAGLEGLLGNPQTLELVARVAKAGPLPDTKARLFESAVELLRKEHRDSKVDLQSDKTTALDAAGAAFAALILTGSEALVVETAEPAEGEIPLGELAALPHAHKLELVLGSRLFATAGAANRFSYWHRRVGEYLGSRWLARQADTALKRKRLLALFQSHGVVPASLRGLHAWLAHHNPVLAPAAPLPYPMGLIEYGDADGLAPDQARLLLAALQRPGPAQSTVLRLAAIFAGRVSSRTPACSKPTSGRSSMIPRPNSGCGCSSSMRSRTRPSPRSCGPTYAASCSILIPSLRTAGARVRCARGARRRGLAVDSANLAQRGGRRR